MKFRDKPIQNTLAIVTAGSAAVGYFVINYSAKDIIIGGTPVATAAGVTSGLLNAIFHSLPVQRFEIPQSIRGRIGFAFCMVLAVASTGVYYASAEQSVIVAVSTNKWARILIAGPYQFAYALPAAVSLHTTLKNLANLRFCQPKSPEGYIGLNDGKTAQAEELVEASPISARKVAIYAIAYGVGLGGLYVSAAAAQLLFSNAKDPSAIAEFYKPIYEYLWASFLAHLAQLPLSGEFAREGIQCLLNSLQDFLKSPSKGKAAVATLNAGILVLTTLTTYVIASYGGVSLFPLILALASAVFANYVPSVKCSQAVVDLSIGQPTAALRDIISTEEPGTFYAYSLVSADESASAGSFGPDSAGMLELPVTPKGKPAAPELSIN